ncbi:MAG TPA: alpha/beta fold hydrolase [Edaphobacter sp.]|nr:alpha/beta fold hydrolase [Edaphobacter sp.]
MQRKPSKTSPRPPQPEVVAGSWLLKAFAIVIGAALLCTYATLCFLFYRGQWQLVLHPVRTTGPAPADLVRFSSEGTGQPQLAGEWMPATTANRLSEITILFLPGGDGTSAAFAATQTDLREIGVNVFTFDYRGYGRSAPTHPSEQRMREDAEAAWRYATSTRHIPGNRIVPYGVGVGASLATSLAERHGEIPGIILDSPKTDLRQVVSHDSRFRFLPVSLLFHEDFAMKEALSTLQRPKLLIYTNGSGEPEAFRTAAAPKSLVAVETSSGPRFSDSILAFLNEAVPVSMTAPAAK